MRQSRSTKLHRTAGVPPMRPETAWPFPIPRPRCGRNRRSSPLLLRDAVAVVIDGCGAAAEVSGGAVGEQPPIEQWAAAATEGTYERST